MQNGVSLNGDVTNTRNHNIFIRCNNFISSTNNFVNYITDYPYPYVVQGCCWQFPCVAPSDWSAQGYLAYTESNTQTADDVGVFSMADGNRRTLVLKSAFTEVHAQFSPDGHWLAFTSNESGRDDVYVQSYPEPNIRRLVSSGGGAFPRWSPDGGELFYRASDGRLMRVPIRTITSSVELGAPIGTIRLVEPPARHLYPYDIARDGRILTLAPPTTGTPDVELTLRTNWAPSLKP